MSPAGLQAAPASALTLTTALTATQAPRPALAFPLDDALVRQKAQNALNNPRLTISATATGAGSNAPQAAQLTPPPPPAAASSDITGHVTAGDTGLPVKSVVVTMYDQARHYLDSDTTDRAGSFHLVTRVSPTRTVFFRVNPSGVYPYTFAAQWYDRQAAFSSATPVTLTAGSPVPPVNFVLDKGAQITGVVQAADTGQPLAGVRVYVIDDSDTSIDYSETDQAGHYTTGGLQTGSYRLFFQPDYSSAPDAIRAYVSEYFDHKDTLLSATLITVTAPNVIAGVNVSLTRSSAITGVVTAADTGQPVPDVRVLLLDATIGGVVNYDYTAATGVYTFSGLRPGPYKMFFGAPFKAAYDSEYYNGKLALQDADIISLTAAITRTGVNAQLKFGGRVTGTVTALDTGKPISNVYVALHTQPPDCSPLYGGCNGIETFTTTDASGHYSLVARAGTYRLFISPFSTIYSGLASSAGSSYCGGYYRDAYDYYTGEIVQLEHSVVKSDLNAALTSPGQITGMVTAADTGLPMKGATVILYGSDGSEITHTATSATGQYLFGAVCKGIFKVKVFPNSSDSAKYVSAYANAERLYLRASQKLTGINLALAPGGFIHGVVTAKDTGQPLAGVKVTLINAPSSPNATTGSTGAYTIGPLPAGSYKLWFNTLFASADVRAYASEYYNHQPTVGRADAIAVTAAQTTTVSTALTRSATITGKVSYASGTSDATVYWRISTASNAEEYVKGGYSNSDGTYTLTVPAGSYKLGVYPYDDNYAPGYYSGKSAWAIADVFTVTAGMTMGNVDFVLQKGSRITGRVTDTVTGQGVSNATVSVIRNGDTSYEWDNRTDVSGYYTSSTTFGTGAYKIKFAVAGYVPKYAGGKATLGDADPIAVTAPLTTTVNMGLLPVTALPVQRYLPVVQRQ